MQGSAIVEDVVEQVHPISPSATVTIRSGDGRIHVFGSDHPELKIYGLKRAFSQERLAALQVNTTVDGNNVVIEAKSLPAAQGADRSGTIDFRIYLPQGCTLALVELENGEILLDGMRGESAQARVGHGRLVTRNCFTALQVSVGRGGMDLFYTWWEGEGFSLQAELGHGSVRLAVPPDAAGVIQASTGSGHIRSQFDKERPADAHEREMMLGAGGDIRLTLRTGAGNIRVERSY